jgi:hypothetical protein
MQKYIPISVIFLFAPLFVFAATITSVIELFRGWVSILIPILASLALLVFMWGIVKYLTSAGDEEKAKEGKSIMIYGVIALFVMFSVAGLIAFIGNSFQIDRGGPMMPPVVGGLSGESTGGGTTGGSTIPPRGAGDIDYLP